MHFVMQPTILNVHQSFSEKVSHERGLLSLVQPLDTFPPSRYLVHLSWGLMTAHQVRVSMGRAVRHLQATHNQVRALPNVVSKQRPDYIGWVKAVWGEI